MIGNTERPSSTEMQLVKRDMEEPPAIVDYNVLDTEMPRAVPLRDYLRAVRKRLWLVIGLTLLLTTIVAVYIARQPDIYRVQARVQVDAESNLALGGTGRPIVINATVNDPTYLNTQIEILRSAGLLRRVVKTLDLPNNPNFLRAAPSSGDSTWQRLRDMVGLGQALPAGTKNQAVPEPTPSTLIAPASADLQEAKQLQKYVAAIQGMIDIQPVKQTRSTNKDTRLVDIVYTHSDAQTAAKIVNALAETFVLANLEKKSEGNVTSTDFLQKRVAELRNEIRSGEERLLNYARDRKILTLEPSQNIVVARLTGLNQQLLVAENDRKIAEAEYRANLLPNAAESFITENNSRLSDAEKSLDSLRQQRAQLMVENTEKWPQVKELDKQIATFEKQFQEARASAVTVRRTNLDTRYRQTLAREQSLREALNQQRNETATQNVAAVTYRILEQEIQTNKTLLDGLLQRVRENDVLATGTPNNIRIIEYALAPDKPAGPMRLQGVLFAAALSVVIGVLLALFLEYLNDKIETTTDVEEKLRLPLIGAIPSANILNRSRLLPGLIPRRLRKRREHPELLTNNENFILAEAYSRLRTSVLLSLTRDMPNTILVTSSEEGEGKTTTAVNLAFSLAQAGASVLLLDADMRRANIHALLNLSNDHGLSNILTGNLKAVEVFDTIQQYKKTNLHVLTAGRVPHDPAGLLSGEEMRKLLSTLKNMFSYIIIDSPPITYFADGIMVSSMVNGVMLVVRSGKTSLEIVQASRRALQVAGAEIIGVVLNNVSKSTPGYFYYTGYRNVYYKAEEITAGTS